MNDNGFKNFFENDDTFCETSQWNNGFPHTVKYLNKKFHANRKYSAPESNFAEPRNGIIPSYPKNLLWKMYPQVA